MDKYLAIFPTEEEATKIAEKMIEACVLFANKKISFNQLWHRVRGDRRHMAVQKVKDDQLGQLLFFLCMDCLSWKGHRDDIIMQTANRIATVVTKKTDMH